MRAGGVYVWCRVCCVAGGFVVRGRAGAGVEYCRLGGAGGGWRGYSTVSIDQYALLSSDHLSSRGAAATAVVVGCRSRPTTAVIAVWCQKRYGAPVAHHRALRAGGRGWRVAVVLEVAAGCWVGGRSGAHGPWLHRLAGRRRRRLWSG